MKYEHCRLEKLLEELKKVKDLKKFKSKFSEFHWNLEKHIFVEERVVFYVYNRKDEKGDKDMFNLLKEHKDILWEVKKVNESIDSGEILDLSEICYLLKEHVKFEEEAFYPKMDEELEGDLRRLIIERAEEIILG